MYIFLVLPVIFVAMEVNFKHSKTFRYQITNDHPTAKTVLYVLHGYGQLVEFFIQKFKDLNQELLIVAPEGMHRFYRKGNSGRVGASWMTKEARETDIADNMDYLNALDLEISNKYPIENRILLGFSQGGSTAIRWKINKTVHFDSLIIWASDFPPDVIWNKSFIHEANNYFVIGENDDFFNSDNRQKLIEYYLSLGFETSSYLGHHDINNTTLQVILNNIQKTIPFGTVSD